MCIASIRDFAIKNTDIVAHSSADKQNWYDAHEQLKNDVADFTHIATTNSGHDIMIDEPGLVIDNFNLLISKLP